MIARLNNKGFVFIETIITVVVLTTTLLLLFNMYSNVVNTEKRRLYYDDMAYVYKTIAISDVLKKTIDEVRFTKGVENSDKYLYVFNVGSKVYTDNDMISVLREQINFVQLVYVRKTDVADLKQCIKTNNTSNQKCKNTIDFVKSYGYDYLSDYLLTLDITNNDSYEGVLISLIYETKNGNPKIDEGKYQECLQEKINSHYNVPSSATDDTKKQYIEKYNKDDKLFFDMACENAYYISWVYL